MRLIPMNELKPAKGISYSRPHIYRLINADKFPKPVKVGENRIAFVEAEIDAWLRGKIAARDASEMEAA